jgi:hypothetical protein
MWNDNRPRA